jgi:hypothetical protein
VVAGRLTNGTAIVAILSATKTQDCTETLTFTAVPRQFRAFHAIIKAREFDNPE